MNNIQEKLADFASVTAYRDIPEGVVHETKRTLLDSIGCALAALSIDKGERIVALAKRLGGPEEATIVGTGYKVSPTNAALATGELINALDYDALYQPGGHVSPNVIPAPLAVAEMLDVSGEDLILATAISHEVATRVNKGMSPLMQMLDQGDGRHVYRWTPAYGGSRYNIGAVGGVGRLLDLDRQRMVHAIGIAGHHAQVPTHAKFSHSIPTTDTKYGTAGWQSTGAVISALLAEMDYSGDVNLFDGENGLWRFTGSESWSPERVSKDIGDVWYLLEQQYKPYPCCRLVHTSLDLFYEIIREQNLLPQDIDAITTFGHPYGEQPHLQNRTIKIPVDAQFSISYIFSAAAHQVKVGVEWQDLETLRDPQILDFMDKVSYKVHPRYHQGPLDDPMQSYGKIEVTANGDTFSGEDLYARGTPREGHELSDTDLIEKFRHNAMRVLPENKIDDAVHLLLGTEQDYSIRELMSKLSL